MSRGMQNLTARYNYIYNTKVMLNNHQLELAETYADNYDQVLPVYIAPEADNSQPNASLNIKSMDDIIKKAQLIILEKSYSNYIDDAYILLGKANFFNANYFNASEYFDYTASNYKSNLNSYTEALNWKARSLMQTRRISEASSTLDSLSPLLNQIKSKNQAEPLATMAQMSIYKNDITSAIAYLKDAIKATNQNQHKIRWTYILAQLYEKQKNDTEALANYRKVEKSNAPFEMYFNANLNRIKIKSAMSGIKTNKQDQLLALLKDDKNLEYNDQVYYQVAESYAADGDYRQAEKYYLLSIQKSTTNAYQKGRSYLSMADLNFKYFKNYLKAKSYYDSTVNTLPKNYPGYDLILKKNQNLEYLTDRYEAVTLQDTLQFIARLPEDNRMARIEAFVNPVVQMPATPTGTAFNYSQIAANPNSNNKAVSQSSFYFSNPAAVGIGFSDFRKKWGNRKLDNNWRQSIKSSAQETIQDIAANISGVPSNPDSTTVTADQGDLVKQYSTSLPLTPELVAKSNQKIIDAYYDIANFYLQELNDTEEAEQVYQKLLDRFPSNNHLAAIYYSLFLINKESNPARSADFKDKILKEFPSSAYAKTILDPSFSIKQSELETAANKRYNEIFQQYEKKAYPAVIEQVDESLKTSGSSYLSPQLSYLRAIAIGRTSTADSLITAFTSITVQFPEDKLVTPLVKDHLAFITQHLSEFKDRKIALPESDSNEFLVPAPIKNTSATLAKTQAPVNTPVTTQAPPPAVQVPVQTVKVPVDQKTTVPANPVKVNGPFSTVTSTVYYYVIHVADASLTLSSSRFGIGQFNRGNYTGSNLKHQLKEFDNDQLIYVGNFSNFEDAKTYAAGIDPQLKQIMKVPVNIYTSFIISKENFDKVAGKALLNMYLEFYKNNY